MKQGSKNQPVQWNVTKFLMYLKNSSQITTLAFFGKLVNLPLIYRLLMAEIRRSPCWYGKYPIIYKVLYIQTVVVWDFLHQQ